MEWVKIVLIKLDIVIIVIWLFYLFQMVKLQKDSDRHFRESQDEFEKGVQIQRRNQAESDVTQLRIKKAEFLLMPCTERIKEEWVEAMKEIDDRLNQYKCRTSEIDKKIEELNRRGETR